MRNAKGVIRLQNGQHPCREIDCPVIVPSLAVTDAAPIRCFPWDCW
jgi:hypothetical protein